MRCLTDEPDSIEGNSDDNQIALFNACEEMIEHCWIFSEELAGFFMSDLAEELQDSLKGGQQEFVWQVDAYQADTVGS